MELKTRGIERADPSGKICTGNHVHTTRSSFGIHQKMGVTKNFFSKKKFFDDYVWVFLEKTRGRMNMVASPKFFYFIRSIDSTCFYFLAP